MAFKNINKAIDQELGRIKGVQKNYEYRHYGRPFRSKMPEPDDFDIWFLKGIRHYESKGLQFQFLAPGLVRIIRGKGLPNLLRTLQDFEREYQEEYLPQFY